MSESDKQFLIDCYGVTSTEANNILRMKRLDQAIAHLEQRGFKPNEVLKKRFLSQNVPAERPQDEVYVGSGQAQNKPNRDYKITFFTDGLLINNQFHQLPQDDLKKLKKSVKKGEFDGNLLGDTNELANFEIDHVDRPYNSSNSNVNLNSSPSLNNDSTVSDKFSRCPRIGQKRVPKFFSLDRTPDSQQFVFQFQNSQRTAHINSKTTLDELIALLSKHTTHKLQLLSEGKKIKPTEKLHKYIGKENVITEIEQIEK